MAANLLRKLVAIPNQLLQLEYYRPFTRSQYYDNAKKKGARQRLSSSYRMPQP
jgi:hypothetical protein